MNTFSPCPLHSLEVDGKIPREIHISKSVTSTHSTALHLTSLTRQLPQNIWNRLVLSGWKMFLITWFLQESKKKPRLEWGIKLCRKSVLNLIQDFQAHCLSSPKKKTFRRIQKELKQFYLRNRGREERCMWSRENVGFSRMKRIPSRDVQTIFPEWQENLKSWGRCSKCFPLPS